jgi:hypothetical protein
MADCVITYTVRDSSGAVVPNATITFEPVDPRHLRGADASVIVGQPVKVIASGGGVATVTLKTGIYAYRMVTSMGEVVGSFTVPEATSADFSALLSTPEAYQIITWPEYQALVVATVAPFARIAAGLAATADGALFMSAMTDDLGVYRRVGAAAVRAYTEV